MYRRECIFTDCIWTAPAGTGRTHVSSRPHPKCCSLSCPSSTCMPLTAPAPLTRSSTCAPSTRNQGELTSITSRQWCCPPCCLLTTGSCGELPSCVILNKLPAFSSVLWRHFLFKANASTLYWQNESVCLLQKDFIYLSKFGFILSSLVVVFSVTAKISYYAQ